MGQLVEWLFEKLYHVERLDPDDETVALRIAFQVRSGREIVLEDGTRITPGSRIAELHLRNDLLADIHRRYNDPRRVGLEYMRITRRAMAILATRWSTDPRLEGVVAVHATNLFPEHAHYGGFEVRELLPVWRRKLLSWHVRRIVTGAHPRGHERVMLDGRPRELKELWLSREMCIRLFGEARTRNSRLGRSHEETTE